MKVPAEKEVLPLTAEDDRNHVCFTLSVPLTVEGVLDRAEDFTHLTETWPAEGARFFGEIAVQFWQKSQTQRASKLLNEALSIACSDGRE